MATVTTSNQGGFRATVRGLPGSAKAGIITGVLGFLTPVTVERERFVSGEAVCEFFDFGAWIFGIVTVVTGIVTLVEARTATRRLLVLVLGLVIVLVGVLHVMRAYGVIGSPC